MGQGKEVMCKKCGHIEYVIEGVGMMYPLMVEELVQDIIAGVYGDRLQKIVIDNPEANINGEKALYLCPECGSWKVEPKLTIDTVSGSYRFKHRCEKCNHVMHIENLSKEPKLKCPECGEALQYSSNICWD